MQFEWQDVRTVLCALALNPSGVMRWMGCIQNTQGENDDPDTPKTPVSLRYQQNKRILPKDPRLWIGLQCLNYLGTCLKIWLAFGEMMDFAMKVASFSYF